MFWIFKIKQCFWCLNCLNIFIFYILSTLNLEKDFQVEILYFYLYLFFFKSIFTFVWIIFFRGNISSFIFSPVIFCPVFSCPAVFSSCVFASDVLPSLGTLFSSGLLLIYFFFEFIYLIESVIFFHLNLFDK